MKISICMSYFRRSELLRNTLHSIQMQGVPNLELVIVNDDIMRQDIIDLVEEYKNVFDNIKLIHTNRDYYYRNQNVAANIGVKQSSGDIIILQNPENIHAGNVIQGLVNLIDSNRNKKPYFCVRCISLTEKDNIKVKQMIGTNELKLSFQNNEEYCGETNPRSFFFCAAFLKKDFINMGGFDERITIRGYDDDLLAFHMKCNNFDIRILSDEKFWVLHQNHQRNNQTDEKMSEMNRLVYSQYMSIVNRVVSGEEPPIANFGREWGILK